MKKFRTNVTCCSVAKLCPILCNPINGSPPGFSVHHYLPEFAQTHVHRVSDTIQPSHPLLSSSPPAFNLSQHQGLYPNKATKMLVIYRNINKGSLKYVAKKKRRGSSVYRRPLVPHFMLPTFSF